MMLLFFILYLESKKFFIKSSVYYFIMISKVCCIVYNKLGENINFLLLHKSDWWKGWELIKGDVKENENVFDSAIREVNEATSLNLNNFKNINYNFNYSYLKGLNFKNVEINSFAFKSNEFNVILNNEHDYYKWVSFDRAIELLDFDEQKKLLEFFNKSLQ